MYVMLVDDEQWIVNGLIAILKKRYPHMEVASYVNPLNALEAMRSRMPDLLITDIRMPQMEGIELIINARALGLKFYAVLTGLDDFTLIQQSLRLQVTDYLIKPVNKQELFSLVDTVLIRTEQLVRETEQSLPIALRLLAMYGLLWRDEHTYESVAPYRTSLILILKQPNPSLQSRVSGMFDESVELWNFEQVCYLFLSKREREALAEITEVLGSDPSVLSFILDDFVPEKLHEQFGNAMKREGGHLGNAVAFYCASPPRHEEAAACLMKHFNTTPAKHAPEKFDAFLTAVGRLNPFWRCVETTALCLTGKLNVQGLGELLRELPPVPAIRSQDVRFILQWLNDCFSEPITLTEAASKVCLQANYFTTLFKKETGVSFIQYLNELRVDKACRMIFKDPSLPFEQLSQSCGFTSARYFFATFKKFTGQTPGDYRLFLQRAGFCP